MRNRIIVLLILMSLLFSACAKSGNTGQDSGAEHSGETEETAIENQNAAAKETASEESAAPPWVLFESEDYLITLVDALDPDEQEARLLAVGVNNTDYNLDMYVTGFMINDIYRTAEEDYCHFYAHETKTDDFYGINQWIAQFSEEIGDLTSISFHAVLDLKDPETYKSVETQEKDFAIILPEGYKTEMIFEPIYSMKADRQLLYEDEDRLIELCSLGKSPDDSNLYAFTGIVRVVNQTEHTIPASFAGIRVNGFYIDPYSFGNGALAPGSERYMLFNCQKEDLELAGITTINSIELLMMTSDEENTGAFNDAGGSWYPVALTQTGETAEDDSQDVQIYEDEYVTVAFRQSWLEWHDVDYTDPYGYYHWLLVVDNKSSENLEFALEDIMVNGVEEDVFSDNSIWPKTSDIGAGSKTVLHLQKRTDSNDPVPEVSFRIQERTFGGGSLLYYSPDPVVIEGKEAGD